jgi:hypothetical protein
MLPPSIGQFCDLQLLLQHSSALFTGYCTVVSGRNREVQRQRAVNKNGEWLTLLAFFKFLTLSMLCSIYAVTYKLVSLELYCYCCWKCHHHHRHRRRRRRRRLCTNLLLFVLLCLGQDTLSPKGII